MKNLRKTKIGLLTMALFVSLIAAAVTVSAYDGTSDPLISLSYLEQYKATSIDPQIAALNTKVTELEAKINLLLAQGDAGDTGAPTDPVNPPDTVPVPDTNDVFTVLQLSYGQRVMCGESCELILRAGSAAVVLDSNSLGGISDLTAAKDLAHGAAITPNHLLLVPRSDGRGVLVMSETAFIMVRGAYTIE